MCVCIFIIYTDNQGHAKQRWRAYEPDGVDPRGRLWRATWGALPGTVPPHGRPDRVLGLVPERFHHALGREGDARPCPVVAPPCDVLGQHRCDVTRADRVHGSFDGVERVCGVYVGGNCSHDGHGLAGANSFIRSSPTFSIHNAWCSLLQKQGCQAKDMVTYLAGANHKEPCAVDTRPGGACACVDVDTIALSDQAQLCRT